MFATFTKELPIYFPEFQSPLKHGSILGIYLEGMPASISAKF